MSDSRATMRVSPTSAPAFKGNKVAVPTKPCARCGRPMSWRKAWAKNWDEVKYCSDACRRGKMSASSAGGSAR